MANTGYNLVNLGNGTFGAYNPSTMQGQSFSSEANAKAFFGTDKIDYSKASAASFDTSKVLGTNADKLVSFAPPPPPMNNASPTTGDLKTGTVVAPTPPQPTAPAITSAYTQSLSGTVDSLSKSLEDSYNQKIKELEAKQKESQTRIDEFTSKQQGVIDNNIQPLLKPFRETLENTERERLYVNENFQANQALTNELKSLLEEGNALIKQQTDATGLASIKNPRINETISEVNARAGVISAVMAARNGQIAQAYNMIDRTISAVTADRQDQLNYYKTIFDFYESQKDTEGNKLINLENDEKTFVTAKINLIKDNLTDARASANKIKDMMVSPESAYAMAQAGVTLNDSVPEINKKMSDYTIKVQKQTQYKTNKANLVNVKTQFADVNGEIQRVGDGYAFESPEDFLAKTGMTLAAAQAANLITKYTPPIDITKMPTSYQEYVLAVKDGYVGSYNDYQTLDANRKAVKNITNNITPTDQATIDTKNYELRVKQAPSQVAGLKAQGKNWEQIVTYFSGLGIDAGSEPAVDDALHRAFQSQKDYASWKKDHPLK